MKIIDNALGINTFANIQGKLLSSSFPWYYINSTANVDEEYPQKFDFSFNHLIYFENPTSQIFDTVFTAFLECLDKSDQRLKKLLRIRAGLITTTPNRVIHAPHIDYDYAHQTALLYLNNSDGNTLFYDQLYDPTCGTNNLEFIQNKNLSISEEVSPVENRFVTFNGLQYHSSSSPVNTERRIVINFNYEVV